MKLKHYLSKYGPRLAVIVLIVALLAGLITAALAGRAGFLRNSGETLTSPLQKATTAVLDWIEGIYGYLYEYDRIAEENNALKAENARLREQAREMRR